MPRMSKKRKEEWAFFLNDRGRIAYNALCRMTVDASPITPCAAGVSTTANKVSVLR